MCACGLNQNFSKISWKVAIVSQRRKDCSHQWAFFRASPTPPTLGHLWILCNFLSVKSCFTTKCFWPLHFKLFGCFILSILVCLSQQTAKELGCRIWSPLRSFAQMAWLNVEKHTYIQEIRLMSTSVVDTPKTFIKSLQVNKGCACEMDWPPFWHKTLTADLLLLRLMLILLGFYFLLRHIWQAQSSGSEFMWVSTW